MTLPSSSPHRPGPPTSRSVGDIAAESVTALGAAFGPYPWTELDVVAVPLGSSVGGMEWPGMVWIESTIFEGGVPGLGDLGGSRRRHRGVRGQPRRSATCSDVGDIGLQLSTIREWTVAHEVGHMWWHTLVGNDSITEPVIDEPLAQHAACLVERVPPSRRRRSGVRRQHVVPSSRRRRDCSAWLMPPPISHPTPSSRRCSTAPSSTARRRSSSRPRGRVRRHRDDGGAGVGRQRARLRSAHRR